ncbi:MAG TPA: biopolymer transporter ExbD [Gemmatimonadaceae bacterium]|nr:biopolymer transporter ExbD [Gemmatimonadaceae bacterium]
MSSLFHRSKQRRAERAPVTAHGNINLVPLVDILTSIVFFSLLTYTGAAMATLTAFDLSLPPTVVTSPAQVRSNQKLLNLLLAVRIKGDGIEVQHSEGLDQKIAGVGEQSLAQFEQVMRQVKAQYPQNSDVLVVPSDEVSYDDVVKVLERLRLVGYRGVSLGTQARGEAVAVGGRMR